MFEWLYRLKSEHARSLENAYHFTYGLSENQKKNYNLVF